MDKQDSQLIIKNHSIVNPGMRQNLINCTVNLSSYDLHMRWSKEIEGRVAAMLGTLYGDIDWYTVDYETWDEPYMFFEPKEYTIVRELIKLIDITYNLVRKNDPKTFKPKENSLSNQECLALPEWQQMVKAAQDAYNLMYKNNQKYKFTKQLKNWFIKECGTDPNNLPEWIDKYDKKIDFNN